jgi:hypothetical protein
MTTVSLSPLRRFVPSREPEEHCDTCGRAIGAEHVHTFEAAARRIRCACESCGILYADVYRTIPREIRLLPDFEITDAQWNALRIPISLAFFSHRTQAGRVIAQYPGPAGAAESLLPLEAWEEIEASNGAALAGMQPDVEALLVNRVGVARDYFLVPIDECYRLVGIIRLHWRGLAGGALVWGRIADCFETLRRKGVTCPR